MEKYSYITLRQQPQLKERAAEWFHQKWNVPKEAYLKCMDEYLNGETEYGWFLCLDGDTLIGGLGVIENDFHDRKDLTPNICAVYTEREIPLQGHCGAAALHGCGGSEGQRDLPGISAHRSHRLLRAVWLGVFMHGAGRWGRRTFKNVHTQVMQGRQRRSVKKFLRELAPNIGSGLTAFDLRV